MIDITTIPEETLIARGMYSTVRAAHEDEKKELAKLCGQLSSIASQVLRAMQPDNDEVPQSVASLISSGYLVLADMDASSQKIEALAKQRQEVKTQAWGKS